jgi:hypothetical protein
MEVGIIMKEEENVLRILKETRMAIEKNDSFMIKGLSNQTINTSSLTQDADNIAVAVIVYSLSKIIERQDYRQLPGWKKFYTNILLYMNKSIKDIENKNYELFRNDFKMIRGSIENLSGKLKRYIKEVLRNAEINKASRLYEHGISMEQTASLLGVTLYELADYVGRTGIPDAPENKTMNTKERIKLAMGMFQ